MTKALPTKRYRSSSIRSSFPVPAPVPVSLRWGRVTVSSLANAKTAKIGTVSKSGAKNSGASIVTSPPGSGKNLPEPRSASCATAPLRFCPALSPASPPPTWSSTWLLPANTLWKDG